MSGEKLRQGTINPAGNPFVRQLPREPCACGHAKDQHAFGRGSCAYVREDDGVSVVTCRCRGYVTGGRDHNRETGGKP